MADVIQKDISTFIKNQFPSFYQEDGPVFVAFVETYYRWLESKTSAATTNVNGSWISVTAQNTTVYGINTAFTNTFSGGDQIAVWRSPEIYDIFTINTVANNTVLTVEQEPLFTNVRSGYSLVDLKRNQLYDSRRLLEYTDVDQTIPEFIVHFKEKYLSGIQFDTFSDIRLLLKHTLDLYRAKGTPQALELLFRIVFGTDIEIYYPGDDVFRLSDGDWVTPRYIEVSLSPFSDLLNNHQIVGSHSGATAFVDRVIRRNVNGRLADVLYVSSVTGTFTHGDLLDYTGVVKLDPLMRVNVLGSLTTIDIDLNGSGENFKIGDILDVTSDTGYGAKARVTSIADKSGILDFNFVDGGWAYQADANTKVLISDTIVRLNNVHIDTTLNPWVNTYTQVFEMLVQPMANVAYVQANGVFTPGANIYSYFANNSLRGFGRVLTSNTTNTTAGYITISTISGDLSSNQFFTYANAVAANVSAIGGYTNITASANILGQIDNLTIAITNPTTLTAISDIIYQYDTVGAQSAKGVITRSGLFGTNLSLGLSNTSGLFLIGRTTYNASNVAIGNTTDVSLSVGVINSVSNFISTDGNYVYTGSSNATAYISSVSSGTDADVVLSNTLLYPETVNVGSDYLSTYANVYLGANAYGFPAAPTANASSNIGNTISYQSITIGRLSSAKNINRGSSYTAAPIIRILDKLTYIYDRQDYILSTTGGVFTIGEVITQASSNARGLVVTSNNSLTTLKRLRFDPSNDFVPTINTTTLIVGTLSGVSANVTSVDYDSDEPSGFDAVITDRLSVSNGSVATVEVIDSGFGFSTDQLLTLSGNNSSASGFANCVTIGTGSGYYRQKGGFLSDQKKLHDGYYYQDYSYDVRSSVTLDKYADMLEQITHVAGTINFASIITSSTLDSVVSINPSVVIVGESSNTIGAVYYTIVGTSTQSSSSSFIGAARAATTFAIAGTSTVQAVGGKGGDAVASSSGISTTGAVSRVLNNTVGIVAGTSTTNAVATSTAEVVFNSTGAGFALGSN